MEWKVIQGLSALMHVVLSLCKKLIASQEQRLKQHGSKPLQPANVKLQEATHKAREANEVLTEIVGDPCHTQMFIEGVPCKCLNSFPSDMHNLRVL